jgi:antitoxin component of MazEF toxin-antitoxin module
MVKTLRPMGNSFGIIIDRPIMDLLGIEPGAELELTPQDGGLLLRPVGKDHKARVRAASPKVRKTHRTALKEVAE